MREFYANYTMMIENMTSFVKEKNEITKQSKHNMVIVQGKKIDILVMAILKPCSVMILSHQMSLQSMTTECII